jgi:hypothetical protein
MTPSVSAGKSFSGGGTAAWRLVLAQARRIRDRNFIADLIDYA